MSKRNITKNQHFVPRVYLKAWLKKWEGHEQCKIFNKKSQKEEYRSSNTICYGRYFYEEDKNRPDNEIETWLEDIENRFIFDGDRTLASIIEFLVFLYLNAKKQYKKDFNKNRNRSRECVFIFLKHQIPNLDISELKNQIKNEKDLEFSYIALMSYHAIFDALKTLERKKALSVLKEFMAIQYVRTPNALNRIRKQFQLEDSEINAFNMIKIYQGSTLQQRVNELRIHIVYIPEELQQIYRFHTNDAPCQDFQVGSKLTTYFGAQIGDNDVIMTMPLSPSIFIILLPKEFDFKTSDGKRIRSIRSYPVNIIELDESNVKEFVKLCNEAIANDADNVIIY